MMKIKELIELLEKEDGDKLIRFDFCGCVPLDFCSYRGRNDALSICWKHKPLSFPTVENFLNKLKEVIQLERDFTGWKGGSYSYTGESVIYVDNNGESTGTVITGIYSSNISVYICTSIDKSSCLL